MIESTCAAEVCCGISSISTVINNSCEVIAPILRTAYKLQETYGDISFKCVSTSSYDFCHSEVCVNAITKIFLTEK